MKEGAQSLRMKMPTDELYLKEATVIYGFYLLPARAYGKPGNPDPEAEPDSEAEAEPEPEK